MKRIIKWIIGSIESCGYIYEAEMIFLKSHMEEIGDTGPYYKKLCKALDDFYKNPGPGVNEAALHCKNPDKWVKHLSRMAA